MTYNRTVKRISFILIYALLLSFLASCSPTSIFKETATKTATASSSLLDETEEKSESETVSETIANESDSETKAPEESEGASDISSESEQASSADSETASNECDSENTQETESSSIYEEESESVTDETSDTEESVMTEAFLPEESASTESESRSEEEASSETEQVEIDLTSEVCKLMDDPSPLGGDYAYQYLGTLEKGARYQALYRAIDEKMLEFHKSANINAANNIAVTLDFSLYGFFANNADLTDALAVFSALRLDRPAYYWIGNQIGYKGTTLSIYVQSEYANGGVRTETNEKLYEALLTYTLKVQSLTSDYEIALVYHDAIVESASYAYLADGVTPDTADDSYSVIGIALNGRGVCESYAEVYQALLNYSNIPNVTVLGTANGTPHKWNLVNIDGGWYYCDLTGDDTVLYEYGFLPYFLITDYDRTNVADTSGIVKVFAHTHRCYAANMNGTAFFYALPERATLPPSDSSAVTLVGERFTYEDGMTYCVTSSDTVCLVSSNGKAVVHIPETLTYEEKTFTVTMIAALDEDGALTGASVLASTEYVDLFIPKSVRLIDSGATGDARFCAIEVDPENPYYEFQNGYLQNKAS